jgi:hypothetical protein
MARLGSAPVPGWFRRLCVCRYVQCSLASASASFGAGQMQLESLRKAGSHLMSATMARSSRFCAFSSRMARSSFFF